MSLWSALLFSSLTALLPAPGAEDAAPPAVLSAGSFKVKEMKDLPYLEGSSAHPVKHKLDLFVPEGHKDFPTVFFVHGGAWRTGDKQAPLDVYGHLGRTLARNGIGAVIINYRLSPSVKHPAHVQDVAKAFAWTYRHIGKHGGRTDQLFVCGHSAGGHLVALLATDETYLKAENLSPTAIRGVVPISGVYVIDPVSKFFDAMFGTDRQQRQLASPVKHVRSKLPPFLIMYADADYRFLDQMAVDFCNALLRHKNEAKLVEVKKRTHITIIGGMWRQEDAAFQALLNFVAQHAALKLAPATDAKP